MHERSGENSFACTVAKVNKRAAWDIEGVVPAVRVFVLPRLLNPLEHLVERLEFDLSIGELNLPQIFIVSLLATLDLRTRVKNTRLVTRRKW